MCKFSSAERLQRGVNTTLKGPVCVKIVLLRGENDRKTRQICLMRQNKKSLFILCSLCAVVLLLSRCENNEITGNDLRGPGFAGSQSCRQCHTSVYNAYFTSTHFNSTHPVSNAKEGSFKFNDSTQVLIQHRDSGLYQIAYVNEKKQKRTAWTLCLDQSMHKLSYHGEAIKLLSCLYPGIWMPGAPVPASLPRIQTSTGSLAPTALSATAHSSAASSLLLLRA